MDELKNLRDIKDIVVVDTFNPLWIVAIAFFIIVAILLIFYFKRGSRKKYKFKLTPKEISWKNIQNIDFNNPKDIAYIFSEDVSKFVNENSIDEYKNILKELEQFKYKKEIPNMNKDLQNRIKEFIRGLKWVD